MGVAAVVAIVTFLMVVAFVLGAYFLFVVRREAANREMLRERIRTGGAPVQAASVSLVKDVQRLSVIGPFNRFLAGDNLLAVNLRDVIGLSGVKTTPGQVVFGSAALGMAVYFLAVARFHSASVGAIAGLLATGLPYLSLNWIRSRRLDKFEEQFPEAVDLIARTLRAGHAFTTGLKMAADELPDPVAREFRILYDQQNFGLSLTDALKAFARRVPLIDARFFVTAVLTQRESGGNLAEVLDNLSAVIRERFKIKRQLRVVSAHGRLTGMVLGALPPAICVLFLVRNPGHFQSLIDNPLGVRMIVVAALLQILGAAMVYKITRVEY